MRMRISILLIILGLALSLFSISMSGALGSVTANRGLGASVTDDATAVFQLVGFNNTDNQISNNTTFKTIGSIQNHTANTLYVKISAKPVSITAVKKWSSDIKFGNQIMSFSQNDTAEKQIQLTLPPGASISEDAIFKTAGESITLSFNIDASTASGSTRIQLSDTSATPRRQILR